MRKSPILEAHFPDVRAKVLAATFGQPAREWYLTELARALVIQPSSLQESWNLEQGRHSRTAAGWPAGLPQARQELAALCRPYTPAGKTAGLIPVLRSELKPLSESVRVAFLYGSIARSEETSASDIDLMVIGTAGLSDLIPALRSSEQQLDQIWILGATGRIGRAVAARLIDAQLESRGTREAWLRTGDAHEFTVAVLAEVASRLARSEGRSGAYTPGALFGAELAVKAGGTFLID